MKLIQHYEQISEIERDRERQRQREGEMPLYDFGRHGLFPISKLPNSLIGGSPHD